MSQSLHLFTPSTLPKQCYSYPKPSFPTLNRGFPVTSVRFSSIRASSSDLDPFSSQVLLASDNGKGGGVLAPATRPPAQAVDSGSIEVDAVTETELKVEPGVLGRGVVGLGLGVEAAAELPRSARSVAGAASSDSVWESKLPPNYQDLLDLLPAERYQNLPKKDIVVGFVNLGFWTDRIWNFYFRYGI
ncbi:hypothetical protein SLA2020_271920 [Shorea laevis]